MQKNGLKLKIKPVHAFDLFLKEDKESSIPYRRLKKIDHIYSKVPAVTHVDYSSRTQIIDKEFNENIYNLIEFFYKKTGIPMLINTSFNIRGEPIVNSPNDALRCFMNTDMDMLVLENFIMKKKDQDKNLLVDKKYKEISTYGD